MDNFWWSVLAGSGLALLGIYWATVWRGREVIRLDDSPYLVRYHLLKTGWGGLYLHHILRNDSDRALHDHPWSFTSLILWGGYIEYYPWMSSGGVNRLSGELGITPPFVFVDGVMQTDMRRYRCGSLVRHKATDLHRLELVYNRAAWTLVWCGPKERTWGYQTAAGWVDYQTHHADMERKAREPVYSPNAVNA